MVKSTGAQKIEREQPSKAAIMAGILPAVLFCISLFPWNPLPSHAKDHISISGITEPVKDVTLGANVVGTISTIFLKEGMSVNKGETILELDKKLESFEVERRKLIWESKAEVAAASVRVNTLHSILESTRELFKSTGSVSREELEKMALDYELAVAEKERLESAEERERIEYEMARESLRKRSLVSPIQGIVVKLFLSEGEACQENQPLARVVDAGRGIFISNVEEWIGRSLRVGQTVDLKIKAGVESVAKRGKIVFVSPVADMASGLIEIKAEFDNQDGSVRPGVSGALLLRGR
jgi:membrane fusion protein, multidrug efflux system